MATTDARAGFRLPWSSDRQSSETADGETADGGSTEASAAASWPAADTAAKAAPVTAPSPASRDAKGSDSAAAPHGDVSAPRPPSGKKPSKFLADLTKAMQAAAEDARSRALAQLQAEAKTHVEAIHGRSSSEAANLRRNADDDVAAVREWSKAEIARIREETESRITDRKLRLETEIDEHAAVIEREIDTVQKTVAAFEAEMAEFFERLLGEDDPSRFAMLAENLPEPPTFAGLLATDERRTGDGAADAEEASGPESAEGEPTVAAETTGESDSSGHPRAGDVADGGATGGGDAGANDGDHDGARDPLDRESAVAAIQAAVEAAASAEVATDAAARAQEVADVAIEIMGNHDEETESDPRYAALGLSPDFDAAEAEALAAADGADGDDIPDVGDEAVAARLAGLAPDKAKDAAKVTSQVVVVGLVSVASIASFKRHLGRLPGVQAVGVASGPESEFIFTVTHAADVSLRDAVPSLPSFQARVTGTSDGVVHVTAHDPEADG
jgi:hypothetical protein